MKVLVVDDSSFIHLVCRQVLEKAGHEVVGQAYDGEEAIEKAQVTLPELIIMDIAMPKKNGLEATEAILEFLPTTKVIAVSAIDEDWLKEKADQVGCFAFLPKPFENKVLLGLVDKAADDEEELKYG